MPSWWEQWFFRCDEGAFNLLPYTFLHHFSNKKQGYKGGEQTVKKIQMVFKNKKKCSASSK